MIHRDCSARTPDPLSCPGQDVDQPPADLFGTSQEAGYRVDPGVGAAP